MLKNYYRFIGSFSFLHLISLFFTYFPQFVRGILYGFPFVFVEPGVQIRGKNKVVIGPFTRLCSYCLIDARSSDGIQIGRFCKIGSYSRLVASGSPLTKGRGIRLGDYVSIAEYCFFGGHGGLLIGSGTIFGQYNSIHPQNHVFSSSSDNPFKTTSQIGVTIGSNCWFGAKCTTLDGVIVGDTSAFGACTLLLKDSYSSNSLFVGSPARFVKYFNVD